MRLWHITHLVIQITIFIFITYSYKKCQNKFRSLKNNFNFSIKAYLDGGNEELSSVHPFFTENSIHPTIKSVLISIKDSVLPRYDEYNEKNPIVLLAISGGVDSMAMLHSFYEIFNNAGILSQIEFDGKKEIKGRLERMYNNTFVVHFNHKLRSSSEKDWNFVKEACNSFHFPFIGIESDNDFADTDVNSFDFPGANLSLGRFKTQGQSRSWRNGKFAEIISKLSDKTDISGAQLIFPDTPILFESSATIDILSSEQIKALKKILANDCSSHLNNNKIGYIFTGHTLDDSVETVIFKLFRGVHIKNIRGIRSFEVLDVNNDISLVRPFLSDYKKSLVDFMKSRNLPWRDDESNTQVYYRRNIIRNDLIPIISKLIGNNSTKNLKEQIDNGTFMYEKGFLPEQIANRMNNLCNQSEMTSDMIESECARFENYIKREPIHTKKNTNFKQISTNLRQDAYNALMDSLGKKKIQFDRREDYLRVNKIIDHMKSFGFHMPECFPIYEWSLIEYDIVKITILKKWIEANTKGVFVDSKVLRKLYDFISCNYNNTLRYFVLSKDYAISHQGMFMRIINKIEKDFDAIERVDSNIGEGAKVYSDNVVNFYSHDSLNVRIDQERMQTFCVKFSVPIIDNFIHEFDIRLARTSDTMASHQLWGRRILGLLGKMNVPCLLKDSIPVIALRKENKIVGIYGLKLIPPYYAKSDVSIDYDWLALNPNSETSPNSFKTYRIYVHSCE